MIKVGSHHMQRQQVLFARLREARLRQRGPAHQRSAPLLRRLCRVGEHAGQRAVKVLRAKQGASVINENMQHKTHRPNEDGARMAYPCMMLTLHVSGMCGQQLHRGMSRSSVLCDKETIMELNHHQYASHS